MSPIVVQHGYGRIVVEELVLEEVLSIQTQCISATRTIIIVLMTTPMMLTMPIGRQHWSEVPQSRLLVMMYLRIHLLLSTVLLMMSIILTTRHGTQMHFKLLQGQRLPLRITELSIITRQQTYIMKLFLCGLILELQRTTHL